MSSSVSKMGMTPAPPKYLFSAAAPSLWLILPYFPPHKHTTLPWALFILHIHPHTSLCPAYSVSCLTRASLTLPRCLSCLFPNWSPSLLCAFCLFLFKTVSLCISPDCPGNQAGFELPDICVLGVLLNAGTKGRRHQARLLLCLFNLSFTN